VLEGSALELEAGGPGVVSAAAAGAAGSGEEDQGKDPACEKGPNDHEGNLGPARCQSGLLPWDRTRLLVERRPEVTETERGPTRVVRGATRLRGPRGAVYGARHFFPSQSGLAGTGPGAAIRSILPLAKIERVFLMSSPR